MRIPATPSRPTVDQLDKLLVELASSEIRSANYRQDARHPVHAPITMGVRLSNGQVYKALYRAWALDLSRDGVGMLMEHELPHGLEMFVNLDSLTRLDCILPIQIVYSQQLLPGTHRIGAIFRLQPAAELKLTE